MTTGRGPSARRLIERGASELEQSGITEARFESELLLRHALGCSREWLVARWHEPMSPEGVGHFFQLVERRRSRVPLQHLTGTQEFYGLSFDVTPSVLIPRPETEGVVEETLAELRSSSSPRIVDVGCGSGCIAVTLAHCLPDAEVFAIDASAAALAVARENARRHEVSDRIQFLMGDLLAPLTDAVPVDAVVSNPPYIAEEDLDTLAPEVVDHEPRLALSGGPEGLAFIRRLVPAARDVLAPEGVLVFEIGAGQRTRVTEIVNDTELELLRVVDDLAGIPRVAVTRRR